MDFQGNASSSPASNLLLETFFLDWVTLKLRPDGTQSAPQPYNEHPSSDEYPYFLALDAAGNIYVTGEAGLRDPTSLLGLQLVTIKYAPTGAVQWVAVSGNGRGIPCSCRHYGQCGLCTQPLRHGDPAAGEHRHAATSSTTSAPAPGAAGGSDRARREEHDADAGAARVDEQRRCSGLAEVERCPGAGCTRLRGRSVR